jgi:hypothetical protein
LQTKSSGISPLIRELPVAPQSATTNCSAFVVRDQLGVTDPFEEGLLENTSAELEGEVPPEEEAALLKEPGHKC